MPSPSAIILTVLVGGVALAQFFKADQADQSSCVFSTEPVYWPVSEGGNGHWYMTVRDTATSTVAWFDARTRCEEAGGHLVSVTSASETAFLVSTLGLRHDRAIGLGSFGWIGVMLTDTGCAGWVTGEPWGYTNWQQHRRVPEPSGNGPHVVMSGRWGPQSELMGTWNDRGGPTGEFPAINCWTVEWSADCNGDGVVDYGQILEGLLADINENGVPDCCDGGYPCHPSACDINRDGTIDMNDFHGVLVCWNASHPGPADVNRDGELNADDIVDVIISLETRH